MNPASQALVNWCNQPAPPFAGDTHVIQFYLDSPDQDLFTYQGSLFFRLAAQPTGRKVGDLLGNGHILGTPHYCQTLSDRSSPPDWVKIAISILKTGAGATVGFFNSDNTGMPTGAPLSSFETDAVGITGANFDLGGGWILKTVLATPVL